MSAIPESVKRQIANPQPNIQQFLDVITGQAKPDRVHLAELFADQKIMQWITENVFEKTWIPVGGEREQEEKHLLCEIEYWYRMGYDYIRVCGGIEFPVYGLETADTAELSKGNRGWDNEHSGPIQNRDDFEHFPWPEVKDEDLWMYHFVAENLLDGMGMMICPTSGFLEIATKLFSYETLAMMAYDDPELVGMVFDNVRKHLLEVYRRLIDIPQVVGVFQGDDMGHKSGTLFSPEFLKRYSLPGHKEVVDLTHSRQKIYCLHACGNLEEIMDYLIDETGIDAKHSFEDVIMPIEACYDRYGHRVGLLGGVDLDILARADEQAVRRRVQKILDHCNPNGRFALGSGNSIANYCKPENVLAMFDEAYCWG